MDGLKKQAKIQRDKNKSSYYRTYEDSPNFYKNLGAIATSGTALTDFETEFPNSVKFFPITNIQIVNGSSVDIIFYPNQRSSGFVIPNNTSQVFDRKALAGGLRSFKVTNTSTATAITDGQIEVNFWREGVSQERAFENMHKAFFKFLRKY